MANAIGLVKGSIVGTGTIVSGGARSVRAELKKVSVVGDRVSPHGKAPHTSPTIANGSTTVFANNKSVTVQNFSKASCQHAVITGAGSVFVGS